MPRWILATALLIVTASPALAKLEIDQVEMCYHHFGPVRKTTDIYPTEKVWFRFTVKGVKVNEEGSVDAELSWKVLDDKGKEVSSARKNSVKGPLALGGDSFPATLTFSLRAFVAGEYTVKLSAKDNLSGEEAGFERKLTLKKTQFAIISPEFYSDAGLTAPAPVGGVVGQSLHIRLWTIGSDRSKGKVTNEITLQVLDKDGKELRPKPLRAVVEKDDPATVKDGEALGLSGRVVLNRPGEFTLRITVIDRNSEKTATFEAPLKVTAP